MRKPIKYTLLALGVLVLLAVAGAAIFVMTFDPNRYKGEIERLAKERTGRTLKLQGNLEVAVFPSLGAKVAGVSFSERGSEQPFLTLDSAHVAVKVLPLLRGEVIVDAVRVAGLKAQLVKDKQGRWNFDDLLQLAAEKPAEAKASPRQEKKAGGKGAPVSFDIAGVKLERSAVTYRDLASGQELAVSQLELSTGRLSERADGKLKFSATAKGRNPDLDAKLELGGQYRVDLAAKSYSVSGFDAKLSGTLSKEPLEAKISAPRIQIAADSAKGEAVTAEVKMKSGERSIDAKLKLAGVEGSAKALVVPGLTADIVYSGPDLPQKTVSIPLTGSLRADLDKQTAAAELTSKFDESNIQAKLGLAKFSPPAYTFDVNVDRLNVDKYLPPKKPAAAKPPAGKPAPESPAADTPVDLSAIKDLDANGRLQFGALQVSGVKLANVKAQVKAANGRVDISPHSASLYEGTINGALSLQASGNRVTVKESLAGVSIGPLLKDAIEKDILEGRGNVSLDVSTAGASVNAMKKALAGSAKAQLKDGAIKGFNLAEILRKARSAVGRESGQAGDKAQRTDFSELNATFSIKNGVAHNEDLDVKAPLFRISGRGDVDIGNSTLDYTVKAAVVATAKGQGGAELGDLSGLTVPVKLSGSFDALKYDVDFRGTAADLAKSKAGERIKEQVEQRRGKIEEQLGSKLKGLFGR